MTQFSDLFAMVAHGDSLKTATGKDSLMVRGSMFYM